MTDYLDKELFLWRNGDTYTVRDAIEGNLILGGLGSGKTSGSGKWFAEHYLKNDFGMLVMTAKRSEKDLWVKYCKKYSREKDLVIFSPDSNQYFNFFDYVSNGDNKNITHNIVDVIMDVIKTGNQNGHEADKEFWVNSLQELIVHAVELCLITKNKKLKHISQIVQSAPRNMEQLNNPKWRQSSKCFRLLEHSARQLKDQSDTPKVNEIRERLAKIDDYFLNRFLHLSEKTRSIILQYFTGFADRFLRYPLLELFSSKTTVTPRDTIKRKIVVIDLPILVYGKIGRDAQLLWKFLWQQEMQKRKIIPSSRPVCLWADEFQFLVNPEKDVQFQSIAREYRACTVYITQNIPNFQINCGSGEIGKTRFKALAGNLGTKIFHANADMETNTYSADLIGKSYIWTDSHGETFGDGFSFNSGQSESLEHIVAPSEFTKLKTGGAQNNFNVEAYVHRQGKTFKSTEDNQNIGSSHKLVTFKQDIL